jgi:large subunit ribosomal protein L35
MPKIKTVRSAAKRVKRTGTGLFMRHHTGANHLLVHKSNRRKRFLRHATLIHKSEQKRFARMCPYL